MNGSILNLFYWETDVKGCFFDLLFAGRCDFVNHFHVFLTSIFIGHQPMSLR